jgi:hypothetical protein
VEKGKGSRRFVPFAWNFATQGCQDQAFQAEHKHYNWYIPKVKHSGMHPKKVQAALRAAFDVQTISTPSAAARRS